MTKDPIRLVQITDPHLYGRSSGTLLNMNTHDSLAHVLDLIGKKESHIDLVAATGDISQDASPEAYKDFLEFAKSLNAPMRWIPGNHDKAWVMNEVGNSGDVSEKQVLINNWLFLFLDTSVEGQVHGVLSPDELEFLETTLSAADADSGIEHCLIFLHHNPTEASAGWMKEIGLKNADAFLKLIAEHKKPRCVVYGHIHQELDYEIEGVRYLCTPSTCIQFKAHVTNFALDKVNPGYRRIRLHADGSIETEVFRVEGSVFEADFTSSGY